MIEYEDFVHDIDYERLYDALDFEPLRQDGDDNDIGQCFDLLGLHKNGDRTGKFVFYRESGLVSCYVCGSCTLLSFVESMFDYDEDQATRWLYQFADDVEQTDESFLNEIDDILKDRTPKKVIQPRFAPQILDRYQPYNEWPEIAEVWAENKGVSAEVADKFKLRFGRIRTMTDAKEPWIGEAIIIPHFWRDKLVGWQQRWLSDDRPEGVGKYKSTADIPRYDTLFNYDRACGEDIPIFIVESPSTVLWLASCDVPAVASFGAKITPAQMRLLRRFQQGVVIAPDNDGPGRNFATLISEYLEPFVPVYQCDPVQIKGINDGCDLGDLAPNMDALSRHLDTMFRV
jgi:hypothetical protein